jgi:hypothetical protein
MMMPVRIVEDAVREMRDDNVNLRHNLGVRS